MKRLLFPTVFLYSSIIIINVFVEKYDYFINSKDGGLVFKAFSLCIMCSVYFFMLRTRVVNFILGFVLGLASLIFTFNIIKNLIAFASQSTIVFIQIISVTIVFAFAGLYLLYVNHKIPYFQIGIERQTFKIEKMFGFSFLVGLLFEYLHFEGADILIDFSLLSAVIIYFPGAFYFFYDGDIKKQSTGLSIFFGFFLSLIPIGIFLKIHYLNRGLLLISSIIAIIIFCITYFLKRKTTETLKKYYESLLSRIIILTLLSILFLLS